MERWQLGMRPRQEGIVEGTPVRKSKSFVAQRRETITNILMERGRISVAELASKLDISPLTVRRDLDHLEEQGIATRRYGEAIFAGSAPAAVPAGRLAKIRELIAREAAKLVGDRESVFINTSGTALGCLPHITAEAVTVITNSGRANAIEVPATMTVLLTGGEVRAARSVMSGTFALNNIKMVSPQWCFLGCAGITPTAGTTSLTLQEATVNALMVERSEHHVLLMDSSKIGVEAGFRYASVQDIDLLITDSDADPEALEALRAAGIPKIIQVDPEA